jgi:hypothetical protein
LATGGNEAWTIILALRRPTAVPNVGRREVLVSRRASRVCSSGIAMPIARGIIGRSIKKYVSNVLPSYATRRCSRILRPRRIAPSASYQCR